MPFRHSQRARDVLGVVVGVSSVAIVGLLGYGIIAIRHTQTQTRPLVEQTAQNTRTIKEIAQKIDSCTDTTDTDGDPEGACHKEGVRGQADAIASINVITKWSAICAPLVSSDQTLRVRVRIITVCFTQLARTEGQP